MELWIISSKRGASEQNTLVHEIVEHLDDDDTEVSPALHALTIILILNSMSHNVLYFQICLLEIKVNFPYV